MVCPSQATHSLLVISRTVSDFYSHFGRRIYNIYGCRMNARKKFRGTTEAAPAAAQQPHLLGCRGAGSPQKAGQLGCRVSGRRPLLDSSRKGYPQPETRSGTRRARERLARTCSWPGRGGEDEREPVAWEDSAVNNPAPGRWPPPASRDRGFPSAPTPLQPAPHSGTQREAEPRGPGPALARRRPPFPAATHGACRRRSGSSAAGKAAGSPATAGSSRRAAAAAAGALRSRRLHRLGTAERRGRPPASPAPTARRGRPPAAPRHPLGPRPRPERGAAPPAAAPRPPPAPRYNFPRRRWAAARSQPCSLFSTPPPPTRAGERSHGGEPQPRPVRAATFLLGPGPASGLRCSVYGPPRRGPSQPEAQPRPTARLVTGRLLPTAPPAPAPSRRRCSPRGRCPLPTSHLPLSPAAQTSLRTPGRVSAVSLPAPGKALVSGQVSAPPPSPDLRA